MRLRGIRDLLTAMLFFIAGYIVGQWTSWFSEETEERVGSGAVENVTNYTGTSPQTKSPRLLCWIMADPHLLHTKVIHQKNTWGRKCDKLLVMSSVEDDSFPAIGMNVTQGKKHTSEKATAAWKYIYKHHISEYDFFIKTDPDTYLVVENLRDFLQDKDPEKPYFYGHKFRHPQRKVIYMQGGTGILLTKESLKRLVTKAFFHPGCHVEGQGEDWKVCQCLALVGCEPQDTKDSEGKERFFVMDLSLYIYGMDLYGYLDFNLGDTPKGSQCCSDYPISFHYIIPSDMYVLEYWLYHGKVKGLETQKVPWPRIDPAHPPVDPKTQRWQLRDAARRGKN